MSYAQLLQVLTALSGLISVIAAWIAVRTCRNHAYGRQIRQIRAELEDIEQTVDSTAVSMKRLRSRVAMREKRQRDNPGKENGELPPDEWKRMMRAQIHGKGHIGS